MSILVVGLGNPGKDYDNTRHNAGFLAIDSLAEALQEKWKADAVSKAEVIGTRYFDKKLILAKPQTFMNLSGQSVAQLMNKFKVAISDVWIISDEALLPTGTLRVRRDGSAGGHNGLKSIIESLGSEAFVRFRIGVGPQPENIPLENFVLQKFPQVDLKLLDKAILKTRELVLKSMAEGIQETSISVE